MSETEIGEAEEEALLKSDNEAMDESGIDDSDDDSDNSMEDEEQKLLTEYMEILNDISKNTLNYDNYIKLTETAFKLNDLDKIRQSYDLFSKIFPVAPNLWMKYLLIENNLASSPVEILKVEELFKKALNDYYSSSVALQYAEFATKSSNAENIWSELLATYALDVMFGRQFFLLYRKYNENREASAEEKSKCYIASYLKELKLPLYEMEESYIDFKVFYEKNKTDLVDVVVWDKVDKYYKRAKDDLAQMLPYEKTLQSLDIKFYQEKANTYRDYIKAADKFAAENVLQTIYERMITDCCLNENCWLDYIVFLEKRDKYDRSKDLEDFPVFQQTAIDMNERALRNCTWSDRLYIHKIHIMERSGKSKTDIKTVIEKALLVNFPTPEPSVAIWMEYLTYLRRHTDFGNDKEVEILRKNFDLCWNTLGRQWGVLADCNCEILQFWGKLEYGELRDPKKGKELWTTVMESSDNSLKSALWIEFIQLQSEKDQESTRKIFRKALNTKSIDNPYIIASAWVRFERCYGTLKQLTYCQEQCTTVLKDYENKFNKFKDYHKFESNMSKGKGIKRKLPSTENLKFNQSDKNRELVDTNIDVADNQTFQIKSLAKKAKFEERKPKFEDRKSKFQDRRVEKQHENEEIDLTNDHLRIFLSNLDYNITEDEIRNGLPEIIINKVNLIKNVNGKGRGFGYLELYSETDVQKAIQLDRKMLNGRPLYISSVLRDKEKREKFKYSGNLEPKKLFVKGVPYDATKEELCSLFEPYGKLKDVRIVYHKSGKPKGIAYIEYENETEASLAVIKMDNYMLRNCHFNIAISAPPPKPEIKEISVTKILGRGTTAKKAIGQKGEQKTRISFLPSSVRKNVTTSQKEDLSSQNGGTKSTQKSNDDFRKLLQK